ncbi:homeobox-domain-containing protein [Gloeophyllum trabeum ATCC 11539]|uniref:Homeobox-domain-containing protein n=1 Tax=Gloeophyllum trabeum (strain ATCC 11539 / FP-39264 / Madison 617) TaxID=670483 RepID=S7S382_GLOTA|nr:homeobox-domain-containing protein [Gloeophyllum trabeum ATCC 11539]EPQ60299.1 homeobox-domain-containing protein [Gloeophyllum trabeum ATCC 11539]
MDKQQQKKPRHRHSAVQLAALNELYDKNEHPSLEDRTSLAKRLGMEVKTVNAWFQNKRASTKKRQQQQLQNKAQRSNNPYELPPISALLASAPSPSTSSPVSRPVHRSSLPVEYDDYFDEEDHIMHSHLPPIGGYPPHQSAFYAGTAEGRHIIESTPEPTVPRKMRFRPTPQQTEELRKVYNVNPHPSKEEREELGESIGMRYQSVTNWFQNQRSLAKKRKEDEADGLNSDAHSVAESRRTRTSSPVTYSAFPPASSHPSLGLGVPSASALHPSLRPSTPSVPRSMPYSVSGSSRARPRRSRPEPYQLEKLKDLFRRTSTPSIEERGALALEIDMELSKVTNWFRNLRQTARRRGMRVEDFLDEYDGGSAEVSRAGTPAPSGVSSAASLPDDADRMEMDVEDADSGLNMRLTSRSHSDASDEEYQEEIVTPSPSPPPSASAPVKVHTTSPISDWAEKTCMERCAMHGVKMEDALLLLSFHQSAVLGA